MRFIYDGESERLIEAEDYESYEEYQSSFECERGVFDFNCEDVEQVNTLMMRLRRYVNVVRLHYSKHKAIYRIGAMTVVFILAAATGVSADTLGSPAGEIDNTVGMLYKELLKVGKWAIIIKGAFDTVSNTIQGDFLAARKNAFAYMLIYVILLGLPWVFEKIEDVFQGVM